MYNIFVYQFILNFIIFIVSLLSLLNLNLTNTKYFLEMINFNKILRTASLRKANS